MEHPRWGATMAVQLTRDVSAGNEIYTYYDYERLDINLPELAWYWELKRQVEKEERLEANRKKLWK